MQVDSFTYHAPPARVVFGPGSLSALGDELDAMGASRALVLCTKGQVAQGRKAAALLGSRCAGLFDGAMMHVPLDVVEQALAERARLEADACVAIGGGSTIGLGKAIALSTGLPVLALPTTFAGSEMTAVWGLTENGIKKTGRDSRVLPRTVIYDVLLMASLPREVAVPSGINAIAHCVEALYAQDGNPVISLLAEAGIRALADSLPPISASRDIPIAPALLGQALRGAWLAGMALNGASMALHHKLCHTLGGSLNLPHALTHTVILPHAVAYNQSHAPDAMAVIARALGEFGDQGAARGLFRLARETGSPTSLAALGVQRDQLDAMADLAAGKPYPNPRPIERAAIRDLLERAYEGSLPPAG